MTTQEKIIEILKKRLHGTHPVYDLYGTTEIFTDIASEIAPMIDKRDAIIRALEQNVDWLEREIKYIPTKIRTDYVPSKIMIAIMDTGQKVEQLKSEI